MIKVCKEKRERVKAQNEARYLAGIREKIEIKVRKCNVCEEMFESAGNRTCSNCKKELRRIGVL